MTRVARGGKCGPWTCPVSVVAADKACARPTEPKPAPMLRSKSRRLIPAFSKSSRFIGFLLIHHLKFIGCEQGLGIEAECVRVPGKKCPAPIQFLLSRFAVEH